MKELIISFEQFDFNGFVEKMFEFAKDIMNSTYAVPWVYESGNVPQYDDDKEARNYLCELKIEGKQLYFTFSDVGIADPINCADGKEFDTEGFCLGEAETIGYLIQFKDEKLIINSAISTSGGCMVSPPSIDIYQDFDIIFNKSMENFIKKFINPSIIL